MNIIPLLTAAAAIAASLLAVEGIDLASGGEFYLASISQLVQETSLTPPPLPATEAQPPPPPPPAEIQQPQPTAEGQPAQEAVPPQPPPPERPFVPQEPIRPPPQQPQQPQPPPSGEGGEFQIQPMPPPEAGEGEWPEPQEFIDPREIQQTIREIKQMRNDIKRNYLKQVKKIGSEADVNQLNEILANLDRFQNAISNQSAEASEIRDAIQEFRESQYWEILNNIRARIQIPQEIKQITQSLKRLERTIKAKAVKNLGFNLDRVNAAISEMRQNADAVQSHYAGGNFEEAQEAMQEFHQGVHPGEIESTIQRVRDIKNMLKRVKDAAIRAEVEKVLQEVIDTFNSGEYRDARETLDEYADDLQNLINKYLITTGWGWGRKPSRQESFSKIKNLEGLIKAKLQEKEGPRPLPQGQPPAQPVNQ